MQQRYMDIDIGQVAQLGIPYLVCLEEDIWRMPVLLGPEQTAALLSSDGRQELEKRTVLWREVLLEQDNMPDPWMRTFYKPHNLDPYATAVVETLMCLEIAPPPIREYYNHPLAPEIVRRACRDAILNHDIPAQKNDAGFSDELIDTFEDVLKIPEYQQEYLDMEARVSRSLAHTFWNDYKTNYIEQGAVPPYPLHYFYPFQIIMSEAFQGIINMIVNVTIDQV